MAREQKLTNKGHFLTFSRRKVMFKLLRTIKLKIKCNKRIHKVIKARKL